MTRGWVIEYGFHICDADADTSTSGGASGAALSWVVGSVVKPTTSRGSKAGGWWLVHFVDGDRLEVQIAASNCGTAWRPQGQPSLAESSQALVAADPASWLMNEPGKPSDFDAAKSVHGLEDTDKDQMLTDGEHEG